MYGSYVPVCSTIMLQRINNISNRCIYLNSDCKYDTYNENDDRYASKHYEQACEHVVLHECLCLLRHKMMNVVNNGRGDDEEKAFRIVVMPDTKTL